MIFAGIKSRDERFAKFMEQPIKCPALHVIGDRDYVKRPAYELLSAFQGAELITHPRGTCSHQLRWLWGEGKQWATDAPAPHLLARPHLPCPFKIAVLAPCAGHVIPRLEGQELASMRSFLERFAAPQPSL